MTPSLALSKEEALKMQSLCSAVAGETLSSKHEALYGLRNAFDCVLVDPEKAVC